ncbi:MAG: glycosyltransferase [Nitrososphaerota archaeon]|nr:glycosyltransferase [Nitrososphaerota archaeon]
MNESNSNLSALMMVIHDKLPDFKTMQISLGQVDWLVLIDNNSSSHIKDQLRTFAVSHRDRCILLENPDNIGLSAAYNKGIQALTSLGIFWLYFSDHDAVFDETFFAETKKAWNALSRIDEFVGIVTPIVGDDANLFKTTAGFTEKYSIIKSAITTGILTNISVCSKVRGFDENIFLDGADTDFTRRLGESGYHLYRLNEVLVIQEFGTIVKTDDLPKKAILIVHRISSLIRLKLNLTNAYSVKLIVSKKERGQFNLQFIRHEYPRRISLKRWYLTLTHQLMTIVARLLST